MYRPERRNRRIYNYIWRFQQLEKIDESRKQLVNIKI